ncbi:hypothetical protein N0V82_002615 [Gnomoniopsis sp. IMI 355080]|nr:hypothetical protein N0V82_002615 [Gnomoniopsis sp. IMI 355080]
MVGEARSSDGSTIQYLDTEATYDLWAQHYDTDGNFLTAVDSEEMQSLMPKFLSMLNFPKPWKIVDLGCGTGRNTARLVGLVETNVVALDLSQKMLDISKQRFHSAKVEGTVVFETYDMLKAPSPPTVALGATAVISTLVVEHIPLPDYFEAVSLILRPGGLLLLTNMHSDMGRITQAGFVEPETGQRIRPTSYAHSVHDIVSEADKQGFEVIMPFRERTLTENDLELLSPRAAKYVGMRIWYGGILRKRI